MMKFKPNQTRTYDGEGFKRRAACLCFKNEKEDEVRADRRRLKFELWLAVYETVPCFICVHCTLTDMPYRVSV